MQLTKYSFLFILALILLLKSILIIVGMPFSEVGLAPDEAQYWTWSQHLDWGYYSKPPGIAWQIWLGTQFFGNTELGIRSGALFIGFCLPFAVYLLAKATGLKNSTAFWSALIMAFTPMGLMVSFFATTDGGYLLFWTLSCAAIAYSISQNTALNYPLIGILLFCGALFKWPIFLLWIFVLFYRPSTQKEFISLLIGFLISLLALLPSVIWNSEHEWSTFRHVWATIQGGHKAETAVKPLFHGNFWGFLGSQALLLSPLLFLLLLIAFTRLSRKIPRAVFFCGALSLLLLSLYCIAALFQKIQGNWCLFAYPTGIVFVCWWLNEQFSYGKTCLAFGLTLAILASTLAMSIPYIQSRNLLPNYPISYKMNPFHQNVGWKELPEILSKVGYNPDSDFLFGDKYQISSILSFYSPKQKRAYFFNLGKCRKNQFCFWSSMSEQKGKTGYFVFAENSPGLEKNVGARIGYYQEGLASYFDSVKFVEVKPLFYSYGKMVKGAIIFRCEGYQGQTPEDTDLY